MTRPILAIQPVVAALALVVAGAADAAGAGFTWKSLSAKPDAWYRGDEAARLAENVLSHQSEQGDWPKNLDTSAAPYRGDRSRLRGTFDNGATIGEMRFLARALRRHRPRRDTATPSSRRSTSCWPHSTQTADGRNRTRPARATPAISRSTTTRWSTSWSSSATWLVRVTSCSPIAQRREAADRAFAQGVACILKCQVKVDGRLTAVVRSTTK